jgi:membrane protein DedA with SNARE-associated domain
MSLEGLITTYGYWALLVGTFCEGETVLILAGIAAHQGYLQLPWVIAIAFLGSFTGDQLFFFMGRFKGKSILAKRPRWQVRAERVHRLLERYQNPVILGYRFLYGLRSVIPFAVGASQVTSSRFVLCNTLNALVWAASLGTAGYFCGAAVEAFINAYEHYEMFVVLAIFGVSLSIWAAYFYRKKRLAISLER